MGIKDYITLGLLTRNKIHDTNGLESPGRLFWQHSTYAALPLLFIDNISGLIFYTSFFFGHAVVGRENMPDKRPCVPSVSPQHEIAESGIWAGLSRKSFQRVIPKRSSAKHSAAAKRESSLARVWADISSPFDPHYTVVRRNMLRCASTTVSLSSCALHHKQTNGPRSGNR